MHLLCCRVCCSSPSQLLPAAPACYHPHAMGYLDARARCVQCGISGVRLQSQRLDTVKRQNAPGPSFGAFLAHLRQAGTIAVSYIKRRARRGQGRTVSAWGEMLAFFGRGGPEDPSTKPTFRPLVDTVLPCPRRARRLIHENATVPARRRCAKNAPNEGSLGYWALGPLVEQVVAHAYTVFDLYLIKEVGR